MKAFVTALFLSLCGLAKAQFVQKIETLDAAKMSIPAARERSYPGSELRLEQNLKSNKLYTRQVVSYQSDGLKIYALLTVPKGTPPKGGWPAIVFNHGYIPPKQYRTTKGYVAYQDAFARAGFVTLKSDYRGHGRSQGISVGGYYAPDHTTDVLNAVGSLRRDRRVNVQRIGMWGHSMGGFLTLRAMVIDPQIKAGVIWAGVLGDYHQLIYEWNSRIPATIPKKILELPKKAVAKYGKPKENPEFWEPLSANSYLRDLGGPIQLHMGTADLDVPVAFHHRFAEEMRNADQNVEHYIYLGDDHNLSQHLRKALKRSVAFFEKNL